LYGWLPSEAKFLNKGVYMIMFDIAEWVANVLILGIGVFFWVLAIGMSFLIITELIEKVKE
tara:strand:- start:555 stop:737 length:183 start_codon:yes stop_codon:yes gene_type:complete